MEDLFIIAGLGNPGRKYEETRHNLGFNAVDLLAKRNNISITKLKHKALLGDGTIEGVRTLLVKPQTYMNLSGESIRELVEWHKVPLERLIIIYDDVDLALGRVRVRPGGSSGSHNGMKSVIYQLQADSFPRVRIGMGRPPEGWDLADFVLAKFSSEERKIADQAVGNAADATAAIIKLGIETAMNRYNA